MNYTFITIPVITSIVYAIIDVIKTATNSNEKFLRFIPIVACALGIICSVISFYCVSGVLETSNVFVAIVIGAASGLAATGTNQIFKQFNKDKDKEE